MQEPFKILDLSDTHEGSCFGLTLPATNGSWHGDEKWHEWQKLLHDWFFEEVTKRGPYDMILHKGEMIHGPGKKSTLGLHTTDVCDQAKGAANLLLELPRKPDAPIRLCRASGYHSRGHAHYEEMVVDKLGKAGVHDVTLKTHQRFEVNGWKFDAAHKVGGSRTAYCQGTQLQKGAVVDILRQWMKDEKPADVYLRGHNHYDFFLGNHRFSIWQSPALEWPLGELSVEIDSPYYFVGFNHWEVWPDRKPVPETVILRARMPEDKYEVIK